MDVLTCRCGWGVYPGLDCQFCGIPADDVIADAELIAEDAELIAEVLELRPA